MAMVLFYNRINWENYPSVMTPINEINLNKLDFAAKTLDERTVQLDTTKAEKTVVQNTIKDWVMDEETGIITITKVNGEQILFDLNIEKIPVSFSLSEDGILTMKTEDGSQFTANIGSMIPVYTFNNTDTISVTVSGEGNNKIYSFEVKDGSITEEKLQPNYLAEIKIHSESAEISATSASESAASAKEDAERAEIAAENAAAIASVEIMTTEKAGIGKPDGETITADEDGTMRVTSHSDVALNRQTLGYTKKNCLKLFDNSQTINGIKYTVDLNKGTITIDGTATAYSYSGMGFAVEKKYLKAGTYIFNGCPPGGSVDGVDYYRQTLTLKYADGTTGSSFGDCGTDVTFSVSQEDEEKGVYLHYTIYVFPGTTVNNITFHPMVRLADITDNTFEPYMDDVDTRLKALTPVNNLLATVPGSPLDAVMGKMLDDKLNEGFVNIVDGTIYYVGMTGYTIPGHSILNIAFGNNTTEQIVFSKLGVSGVGSTIKYATQNMSELVGKILPSNTVQLISMTIDTSKLRFVSFVEESGGTRLMFLNEGDEDIILKGYDGSNAYYFIIMHLPSYFRTVIS